MSPLEILTESLKWFAKCIKEFTTKLIVVVSKTVENINELGNKQFAITAEAKTVYRELLAMLTHLTTYLKKVDNFACYAEHEEQKATVLNALRQAEPIFEPLNGYLEQLVWCLQQAKDSFRVFKDYCDDKLSTDHKEYKSTADKVKLSDAIAGGATILASVAAGTATFGIGTVIGIAASTNLVTAAAMFKDTKEPWILLRMVIGEIKETSSSVQHTAGKVQAELKETKEQIKDIRFFMSNQASLIESINNLFEELGNFATITSECQKKVSLKQQDLENFIFQVIGIS